MKRRADASVRRAGGEKKYERPPSPSPPTPFPYLHTNGRCCNSWGFNPPALRPYKRGRFAVPGRGLKRGNVFPKLPTSVDTMPLCPHHTASLRAGAGPFVRRTLSKRRAKSSHSQRPPLTANRARGLKLVATQCFSTLGGPSLSPKKSSCAGRRRANPRARWTSRSFLTCP